MGLDAAWALEWLAAIRRPFHALAEHNLDAIVCFDNQHADVFCLTQRDYSMKFVNSVCVHRLIIINNKS